MASFPKLKTGSVAKYPATRQRVYRTMVHTFCDMSEQRFSKGNGPLCTWQLTYSNINTADKETLRGFFDGREGATDTTWDITIEDPDPAHPTTYTDMQFVPNSKFVAKNHSPDRWEVTLQMRQTRKQ